MAFPLQRLLLATEHTEFDTGAERVALALAARHGVTLAAVVPLVTNPEFEAVAPDIALRAERETARRSQALRDEAAQAGVTLDLRVRRDEEAWHAIVAEARDARADAVVVRRRGRRGFAAQLLVGEMVGRVVAEAPCSALVVPRACGLWSRGIVVAGDRRATPLAEAIAAASGLAVTRCADDVTAEALAGRVAQSGADLVVVPRGPLARAAIERCSVPVLVAA
jgi:nucleotide-binding universal stress UspA family protein